MQAKFMTSYSKWLDGGKWASEHDEWPNMERMKSVETLVMLHCTVLAKYREKLLHKRKVSPSIKLLWYISKINSTAVDSSSLIHILLWQCNAPSMIFILIKGRCTITMLFGTIIGGKDRAHREIWVLVTVWVSVASAKTQGKARKLKSSNILWK